MEDIVLKVKDLKVSFHHDQTQIQVVRGFDLKVKRNEIVGIVGESGSGKTVSVSSMIKLIDKDVATIDSGEVIYEDKDLMKLTEKEMKAIRGNRISYIFQNPSNALNPYKRIGKQLETILSVHRLPVVKEDIIKVLHDVGIEDALRVYDMFPFQLSGGLNQRVMIAECILCRPTLLIADEPTSSIDTSVQKKILELLKSINTTYDMSMIIITHDFDVAKYICDKLVIMYGGLVVEEGSIKEIINEPLHPYTKELIKCANALDSNDESLYTLEGNPPTSNTYSNQCPFVERCKYVVDACLVAIPKMININESRTASERKIRCVLYDERGLT